MTATPTRTADAALWLPAAVLLLSCLPATPARAWIPTRDGTWSVLAPAPPVPGARREYAAILDVQRDRYLLFGGLGDSLTGVDAPDYNDVWALSLGANPTWHALAVAGPSPGARHSPQWGYDPARQRLLLFGGYGHRYPGSPNAYLDDVWELDLDGTPAWHELFPGGAGPSGRLAGTSVYDPLRQRLVVYGGTVGASGDVWQLDLSVDPPTWSILAQAPADSAGGDSTGGGHPFAGYGMTSIYDPVQDRLVLFGGSTSDGYFGVQNEVWQLSLSGTPAWTELSPGGIAPSPRRSLTSIYDPVRDRMVVFAGWDNRSNDVTSFLSDAWALSLGDNPQWSELDPHGGPPPGRDAMAAVYDPGRDRMVVFGGWSGVAMLSDTWSLEWGDVHDAASLLPSAQADVGEARMTWGIQNATGSRVAVFRRPPGGRWSSVAVVPLEPGGGARYVDDTVEPGGHYAYMAAVPSPQGATFGGEIQVDVPTTAGVGPDAGLALALAPVRPQPVVGAFQVSFVLPGEGRARLDLFDLAGRRVAGREVGELGAGTHTVGMGGDPGLSPGVYFLRLERAGVARTRRVVIGG